MVYELAIKEDGRAYFRASALVNLASGTYANVAVDNCHAVTGLRRVATDIAMNVRTNNCNFAGLTNEAGKNAVSAAVVVYSSGTKIWPTDCVQ